MLCVFCRIVAREAPCELVADWPDALAIVPRNPVTPGHVLVLPKVHVADLATDPVVTGVVMQRAAHFVHDLSHFEREPYGAVNIITSRGADATQTVWHLHVHVVPRHAGDGLHLPWTGQRLTSRPTDG